MTTGRLDSIRTAANLLAELTAIVGKRVVASPRWPKSAAWFTIERRRTAPQIRLHGILVNLARCKTGRIVTISRNP
jgi:hypothetical protein